jgi:VanZ family protein
VTAPQHESTPNDTVAPQAVRESPMGRWVWLWLPVILYMIGLFVGSSLPDTPMTDSVPDVSLHEIGYFGLTLLLIRALAKERWSGVTASVLLIAFVIAVGYGASLELQQSFIPTRQADVRDLRANAWGAFAAAAVVKAWSIIRRL